MRCFFTAKSDKPAKTIVFLRDYQVFLLCSCFVSREIHITLSHKAGQLVIPRLLVLLLFFFSHTKVYILWKHINPQLLYFLDWGCSLTLSHVQNTRQNESKSLRRWRGRGELLVESSTNTWEKSRTKKSGQGVSLNKHE